MKTKFIKIPVSDRLPEKSGWYDTDCGNIYFRRTKQRTNWKTYEYGEGEFPEYWLEEKEDHSEEMLSVLSEVMRFKHELRMIMSDKLQYPDNFLKALNDAEQLINKVKDNETMV